MAELVVGIDLGTTYSCMAVKRNGKIEVIPNIEGKRKTLSFVYYNNNDVFVGKTGKLASENNPSNGIYEIKRLLGCCLDDPDIENQKVNLLYKLVRGTNGEITVGLNQRNQKCFKYPEEISARILYKLKVDAERFLQQTITKAVITVPAYFNNNQRAATRDAARIAGLEVLKLLNEPSAAALAYINENANQTERTILIYDLGGGTFDVSIVKIQNGVLNVLSVAGDTHLGGQDFLNRMVTYIATQIELKHNIKINGNKKIMNYLINVCESKKKHLSMLPTTNIELFLPEVLADRINLEVSRVVFEEINDDLFKKTIKIVETCISNRRLSKDDIDEVLLVGGSSRIPKIETLLKDFFKGKTIQRNINADEAIAMGAAIEADYIVNNSTDSSLLVDVLPLSIGTVINEETICFNFARNTPLPANSKQIHSVKVPRKGNQGCILSVYEGERVDCSKNVLLGAHEIKWIKNSTSTKRNIEISVKINNSGIIWVTAKGDTIKTFSIALNKGKLEEDEILVLREEVQNIKLC